MTKNLLSFLSYWVIIMGLFFTNYSYSQNLVINPSFETTSSNCANFGGEGFFTDLTGSWDNASNNAGGDSCSSPDLFSACNPFVTNMPNSILGYQVSHAGTRHAGIITYEALDEYREYIQGHLSSPLVAGQTYCVSMFVSLANTMPYATNNMGVYFSPTHYLRDPCPGQTNSRINVTPQLNYTCSAITDTTANWFRLQWNYVATGGESYFIIGNFYNNANTVIVNTGQSVFPNPFAYYYIDDVSVVPNTCCYAEISNHVPFCVSAAASNLSVTGGTGSSCVANLNGTWSGPGITNSSAGTFNPSVAGVGVHVISYTLPCGYVDTMSVVVGPCANLQVCLETNGNLTVSNGVGPYTWAQQVQTQDCSACLPAVPPFIQPCSVPSGCAVTVNAWQTFATGSTVTPPGTYPLKITDQAGTTLTIANSSSLTSCSASCSLTASTTVVNTTCGNSNGSATVLPSGGTAGSYLWSNGGSSATVTSLAAGVYTVTITSGNCSATASATVGASSGLSLSTSSTNASCGNNDGSATVNVTGGAVSSYSWSNGANTQTISNVAAGTYTVTVLGTGGCSNTTSVSVSATGGVTISAVAANTTCGNNNGSASVTVLSGTATAYAWNSGQTSSSISNLAAGTYTVTVSGSGGCSATASVTVNPSGNTPVTINSDKSIMCAGDSAHVCAPSGYASYLWNTGESTQCIYAKFAGNYYVTVTDNGSCTATSNHIGLNMYPLPPVSISVNGDTMRVYNSSIQQWYFNGAPISGATGNVYVANQSGNYAVAVTDTNGCVALSNPVVMVVSGIVNVIDNSEIKIFPNPLETGYWNLEVTDAVVGGKFEIFDNNGRLIYTAEIKGKKMEIPLTVESGIYMFRLISTNRSYTSKLIKL